MSKHNPLSLRRSGELRPFVSLQSEINDLFEDLWKGWGVPAAWRGWREEGFAPDVDVSETDQDITVKLDLPGMSEKDVQVEVTGDALTIRGEKKEEREESGRTYRVSERSYGSFTRSFRLPSSVAADKAAAAFKNGEMTVTLPKTTESKKAVKKIEITAQK